MGEPAEARGVPVWGPEFVARYLRKYESRHTATASAAEAKSAVRLAGTPVSGDVLDCPCGYGRHAWPLARQGYRVTGADRSFPMISRARPMAGGRVPCWVVADYRRLPFADRSFDTVLNLFTSFGFHGDEEDTQVLREFRRVLRPGGVLVLDTTHRDRLARSFQSVARATQGDTVIEDHSSFDLRSGWLEMTHHDGAGQPTVSRIRVYSVTELAAMLAAAGFEPVRMFGGMDGSPLTWDSRMIATAVRRDASGVQALAAGSNSSA